MKAKRIYVIFMAVVVLSLTALPVAAADIPPELCDYMARLAIGKLYVPYYEIEKNEAPKEEYVTIDPSPDQYTEEAMDTEDESEIPDGAIAVQAVNLSRYEEGDIPPLLLVNETDYKADLPTLTQSYTGKGGAVLILHTHGTEAYLPDGVDYYREEEDFRSTDKAETVVAAGEAFAEKLREAGIEVFHDETMYDAASFTDAYTASRNGAREWLKKHPQIRYIFDIHRDAVSREGASCKTLCQGQEKPTAQVMLVIGTNEAGANHPDWRSNLSLAASYQRELNRFPTLARPVYLRRASFNQQLSPGYMLLEVGSAANTLSEAKNAAILAAECFVKLYFNQK